MRKNEEIIITVWCLAYNHEKYIRSALEGFVKQKTSFAYEVIVHDDASTDKTADIIREFAEKYPNIIKPIYQTQNQTQIGVIKLKNFLLPNANGKYIAFCEGDDYWCDENKLQRCYDCLENDSNISMCVHKTQCLNEDGALNKRLIPDPRLKLQEGTLTPDELIKIIGAYPFHTSSYVLKREVVESEVWNQLSGLKLLNGDEILIRCAMLLGNIHYINKVMSCRRLWTVNNYNSRLLKKSNEEKLALRLRTIDGELAYDKLSSYRFHRQISTAIYCRILNLTRNKNNNLKIIETKFKELHQLLKGRHSGGIKLTLRIVVFNLTPKLYRLIDSAACAIIKILKRRK